MEELLYDSSDDEDDKKSPRAIKVAVTAAAELTVKMHEGGSSQVF